MVRIGIEWAHHKIRLIPKNICEEPTGPGYPSTHCSTGERVSGFPLPPMSPLFEGESLLRCHPWQQRWKWPWGPWNSTWPNKTAKEEEFSGKLKDLIKGSVWIIMPEFHWFYLWHRSHFWCNLQRRSQPQVLQIRGRLPDQQCHRSTPYQVHPWVGGTSHQRTFHKFIEQRRICLTNYWIVFGASKMIW